MTRSMLTWSLSRAMVMREMPATSVRPTVSDSMLNARRRNTSATRFRTPGLSSTSATSVCSIFFLNGIRGRLDEHRFLGSSNHRVEVVSGRHHRIDTVFLLHAEVDQHRALRLARARDHVGHLRTLLGPQAEQSMRFGELDEIRAAQRCRGVAAFVEELLPLPHHAQIAVIDDGDIDLHVLLRSG